MLSSGLQVLIERSSSFVLKRAAVLHQLQCLAGSVISGRLVRRSAITDSHHSNQHLLELGQREMHQIPIAFIILTVEESNTLIVRRLPEFVERVQ